LIIIDGVFAHQMAVSPREVVEVIRDGAVVLGAASMGALRAVDCAPAGMIGLGLIYRLFRRGILESDDEVAVATNPLRGFAPTSVALVNVRYAARKAALSHRISRATADEMVSVAQRLFYADRTWEAIFEGARVHDPDGRLFSFCLASDLKNQDARRALAYVHKRIIRCDFQVTTTHYDSQLWPRPQRYPGADPYFGLDRTALQRALSGWLFGSGRYQPYVWSLLTGEPELQSLSADEFTRVHTLRKQGVRALSRLLSDDQDRLASRLWAELEYRDELDAELMRWYAQRTLAEFAAHSGLPIPDDILLRTKHEVARRHGMAHWFEIESAETDLLHGAIPLNWVLAAVNVIAGAHAARRYVTV
jgi:hypothetical protein